MRDIIISNKTQRKASNNMVALICELCGGNNFVKDNGYFVCQNCQTKYTVDEARKIMLEGIVNVHGSVKIDHSSDIQNLLKNADMTFNTNNYSESFKLYSQVLSIDPENAHAIFYRAISSAWQSTVKDCKITEVELAAKQSFQIQHNRLGDSKEYFDFCYDAIQKMDSLTDLMIKMYCDYLVNTYPELPPENTLGTGKGWSTDMCRLSNEIISTYNNGTNSCLRNLSNVIQYCISETRDYSLSDIEFWNKLASIADKCTLYVKIIKQTYCNKCTYLSAENMVLDRIISSQYPYIDAMIKNVESKKQKAICDVNAKIKKINDEYWETHYDIKEALNKERSELISSISEFEVEKENLPAQLEKNELEKRIEKLKGDKKSLGIFKFKQNKEIQASIDEATIQLNQVNESLKAPLSRIQGKIDSAYKRIAEIDAEFNKDRR